MSLASGPALALAATATSGLPIAAAAVAGLGACAVGRYDDVAGERDGARAKGFRGHAAALRSGALTAGAVKVAGVGAAGVLSCALLPGRRSRGDVVVGGALVAAMANLINLFDARPGRALKVGGLAALAVGMPGPAGAATALLPDDLRERTMLGDAGANALGALVGLAVVHRGGRWGSRVALGAAVAMTAASEVVSFTRVIEGTPALRWADDLGRLS
ncbi:MAG TPA: hypothetical protein VNA30_03610 [Mycobacteriales bacterium]|nr:hypothetical protein [Mycobacteriales bacterium]